MGEWGEIQMMGALFMPSFLLPISPFPYQLGIFSTIDNLLFTLP
jgi:hypothetical protein